MEKDQQRRSSAAYLDALTLAIEKKLQRALASASQRRNLLQELFADVALEVDDRAKGKRMRFCLQRIAAMASYVSTMCLICQGAWKGGADP